MPILDLFYCDPLEIHTQIRCDLIADPRFFTSWSIRRLHVYHYCIFQSNIDLLIAKLNFLLYLDASAVCIYRYCIFQSNIDPLISDPRFFATWSIGRLPSTARLTPSASDLYLLNIFIFSTFLSSQHLYLQNILIFSKFLSSQHFYLLNIFIFSTFLSSPHFYFPHFIQHLQIMYLRNSQGLKSILILASSNYQKRSNNMIINNISQSHEFLNIYVIVCILRKWQITII